MKDNKLEIYELLEEVLAEKEIAKKDELIMGLMIDIKKLYKIIDKDINGDSVIIKINKEDGLTMSVLGNFSFDIMTNIATLLAKASGSFLALPYENLIKNIINDGIINDINDESYIEVLEGLKDSFMKGFVKTFKESFLEEIK